MAMARRMWRRWAGRSSWLSVSRWRIAANASPGRPITLSSIEWLTAKLDVQRLRLGGDQPVERGLAPADRALRRLLADHLAPLAFVVAGLGQRPLVVDDVLGRLHDDGADGVEAGPPGPAGDLVELAGLQQPGPRTVVLGQSGEQHGPDRHVDADAERVGAADHLEQPGLGQRLDQPAVLGQHAGVVHADAVAHQPGQRLAEAGGEPEVADRLGDRVLLGPGGQVDARQRLRPLQRRGLGEVHDVDRRLLGCSAAPRSSRAAASSRTRTSAAPAARPSCTTAVGRPVRRVRSSTNRVTSPSVADISRNWACGSSISGTCQAQPRSGSA